MFLSSVVDNVLKALSSMDLWIAIVKSLGIILLAFFLRKLHILGENTGKVVTKIVLVISLPALAFMSFMKDITISQFQTALFSFVYGFVIYTLFILLAKLVCRKIEEPRRKVIEVLLVFGSTTFFGQPIVSAVFPEAFLDSNMFNIAYRVFLYSYCFLAISEVKGSSIAKTLKKIFFNPIIIATFLGFIFWSLQLILPSSMKINASGDSYHFFRIDKTLPWLAPTLTTLGNLSSPLAWIAIGATIGTISFKKAAMDKMAWGYSFIKVFLVPTISLCFLFLINLIMPVSFTVVVATTILWATPPATVAVSYCINYDKETVFASNCSLLGTLVAILGIPFWIIVLTIIQNTAIFL